MIMLSYPEEFSDVGDDGLILLHEIGTCMRRLHFKLPHFDIKSSYKYLEQYAYELKLHGPPTKSLYYVFDKTTNTVCLFFNKKYSISHPHKRYHLQDFINHEGNLDSKKVETIFLNHMDTLIDGEEIILF